MPALILAFKLLIASTGCYVVDQINDDVASVEVCDDGMLVVPVSAMPAGAREGDFIEHGVIAAHPWTKR